MRIIKLFSKIIFPVLVIFFVSCKKDHSVLGVDVQPGVDDLNAENIRGLAVTAQTLPYDSVASYGDNIKFIGSNNDPLFGRSDYGLYLNTNISVSNLNFGATSTLTSAEFVLAVNADEYAGNKDAALSYSIFALNDTINNRVPYYTNDTRHHDITPISISATSWSVTGDGKRVLRIKLDQNYAEKLFQDSVNLKNNEALQKTYKGYYIAASVQNNDEGVVFKADLDDVLSGLFLHYKTTSSNDTIIDFRFSFSGLTAKRYNTVKYTPIQEIKDQFADSTLGASKLYLKGMGMTRVKLYIPFLKNHSDSFKIAVNRAEIVLSLDPSNTTLGTSIYYAPPKLLLLSIDDSGRETYINDLNNSTNYTRFDGTYNATMNAYVFNIALEAQAIFSGEKPNRGFYLVVANGDLSLKTVYATQDSKILLPVRRDSYYERVVIAGSNNAQLKPVFNLNYIRFKND
ncbi:DUF4270 family protein [Aurantibacillus circumpalustris]|uniref:DUF4270 family protein n=1 Tax=Aurantibacillus circumpalustris TaxID=3036359 RepID=UPI00295AB4EF|nr:DUF4270 family protein [Aurantibacillus circumpalustris]